MEKRTRTRRKDTRPAEIVACAMKLFVERGYFETNFQDIADAGNLARSTIYLYFKDKKSILKAALEKKFEENKNILMDFPKEQNDTFQERMVKLLSRMQKITLDDSFKRFCVMMSGLSAKDPEIAKIWKKEIFDKLKNVWSSICDDFNLNHDYREYVFNVLYSVFFMSCTASVCFGKETPFMDFVTFTELTKRDVQQGKYEWMLNHE